MIASPSFPPVTAASRRAQGVPEDLMQVVPAHIERKFFGDRFHIQVDIVLPRRDELIQDRVRAVDISRMVLVVVSINCSSERNGARSL